MLFFRWGGEDYLKESRLRMYMSNHSIEDIIERLRYKARYIGLKYPQNFDLSAFERRISAHRVDKHRFTISVRKNTYWEFSLYEFPSNSCLWQKRIDV